MSNNEVPTAALLFPRDVFLPYELSMGAAAGMDNLAVWSHDTWEHDAIWVHGAEVAQGLFRMLD